MEFRISHACETLLAKFEFFKANFYPISKMLLVISDERVRGLLLGAKPSLSFQFFAAS